MRFLILLTTFLLISSCTSVKEGCDDYFKQFGIDIAAQYQYCQYFEEEQVDYHEAIYKVKNQNFRQVEAFLVENYDMPELLFSCCGYETFNWSEYKFQGDTYSVHMWSDEFDFTEADKTRNFWVAVRKYTRMEI